MIDSSTGNSCRDDRAIARRLDVARDRVEVPERRIDRVIQRLALAFREQVRQQAVA